ncbi:terminase small subunit [Chromobacterium amazonense]|uniref:terminase small subunit n=1 Tax=Chromobacterium amazonense TaxID=1382803 RepID=UPI00237D72AF|nr:terminase small subunit [Chromobacterium amazonense]MDE1715734.1 terminase small subunit [Chromobacterium amazonense]
MVDALSRVGTQSEFGQLVGISQQAVSELVSRGVLAQGGTLIAWLQSYCANLREQAAGRASNGELDLVQERARLAKEQADRVARRNAQEERELAPVWALEVTLAGVSRQIASVLEAIPVKIKRASATISTADLDMITREIIAARNLAAAVEFDWSELDGSERDSEGNSAGADSAVSP